MEELQPIESPSKTRKQTKIYHRRNSYRCGDYLFDGFLIICQRTVFPNH